MIKISNFTHHASHITNYVSRITHHPNTLLRRYGAGASRFIFIVLLMSMLSLLLWNCRKQLEYTEIDSAEHGWELYAAGDFSRANEWFLEAVWIDSSYKDGYNGLGWTYGKLRDLNSAIQNFKTSFALVLQDTTDEDLNLLGEGHDVGKEVLAGITFAYHAKGDSAGHSMAIIKGASLLGMTGDNDYSAPETPNWIFSRDETISSKHVIWTLSSSYFALGIFDSSLVRIKQLLSDPNSFAPDLTTVEGRRELADKIEFLRDNL